MNRKGTDVNGDWVIKPWVLIQYGWQDIYIV